LCFARTDNKAADFGILVPKAILYDMNKEIADRLGPARVPFLLLPPVCVVLGSAVALRENFPVDVFSLVMILCGAIAAHVSVNSFNEFADFRSSLDSKTERTPFSGGSGTLQRRPELSGWALSLSIGALLVTAAIGAYFAFNRGAGILPLGIAGLLIILTYSFWGVRNPIFCLVAPGIGFGPLMVMGTQFALTGHYSWSGVVASLIPFFLVNNLLLLNQFPDVAADKSVGRKNIPIVAGLHTSAMVYAVFTLFTYATIVAGVWLGLFPMLSLIGLLTIGLSVPSVLGAFAHHGNIPRLIPSMGLNVVANLLTPALVAGGMFFG
jgi:1,4-dihydroxy-2-naphthoate octaprenyltransferase